jgi:hypothetical protein
MKHYIYICLIAISQLTSCNDYLDTTPSKGDNEVLNNSEQIEALFNNNSLFNAKTSLAVSESDDNGISTDMYDSLGYANGNYLNGLTFNIEDIENNAYGDALWENEYKKVFTANLIINNIDKITDLTSSNRTQYLAQAHFTRALAMWNLANIFCLPYAKENLMSPGLPIKTTTSYEENVERSSIKDTYNFILADLLEALNTNKEDVDKRWWVSKTAAEAMLARFYLFTQDYTKAAEYAAMALKSNNTSLQDYNELTTVTTTLQKPHSNEQADVSYSELYSYSPNEITKYKENYYSQFWNVEEGIYLIPSDKLISIYDQDNDLRYKQFFNKYGLWEIGIGGFGEDIIYHKFHHYTNGDEIQSGPTVPEMLLTEAEALARNGKYEDAMYYVNKLRFARIKKDSENIKLTAENKQDAIVKIIEERHREMPFVMRWLDIRRLAFNETSFDDVIITRTFYDVKNNVANTDESYEYTLPIKSKRYAQPIAKSEITRSYGQIKQNEYDNNSVIKTKRQ